MSANNNIPNGPKEKAEECPLQDSTEGYRWAEEMSTRFNMDVGDLLPWTCNMIEAGRRQGEKNGYRAALEWVVQQMQVCIECLDDPAEFLWLNKEIQKELEKE